MAATCRAPDRLGGRDWFTSQRHETIVVGNLDQLMRHHGPNLRPLAGGFVRDVDIEEEQMIMERVSVWKSRVQHLWIKNQPCRDAQE